MIFFIQNKYKDIFRISLPLVLSMGATTVMEFTDRVFLGRYSLDALAAAMPAGITSFLFTSFFIGTAGYVNVFIAQYIGANDNKGVGESLWQGIYFSIFGAVCMALLSLIAVDLFALIGLGRFFIEHKTKKSTKKKLYKRRKMATNNAYR